MVAPVGVSLAGLGLIATALFVVDVIANLLTVRLVAVADGAAHSVACGMPCPSLLSLLYLAPVLSELCGDQID